MFPLPLSWHTLSFVPVGVGFCLLFVNSGNTTSYGCQDMPSNLCMLCTCTRDEVCFIVFLVKGWICSRGCLSIFE